MLAFIIFFYVISTRFPYSEMELSATLKWVFLHLKRLFQIKERKPHFKLRKALFKTGLERNCEYKNILEFDAEKDGGICLKKIILLRLKLCVMSEIV